MQNKYQTLAGNTVKLGLGTFSSKILVFLMVRFYTEFLSPADYGAADLMTQTANLLLPLVSLGITDAVFRFAMDKAEDAAGVLTAGLFVILAGSVLALAMATLFSYVLVFLVRAVSIRRLLPFSLAVPTVLLDALLLTMQAAFLTLQLPGWIAIQAVKALLGLDFSVIPGICALGFGVLAGVGLSIHAIRAALRKYRPQMVWLILGLMAGSFYTIIMGPASLDIPQAPVSRLTFDWLGFALGAAILLGLEALRKRTARQSAPEPAGRKGATA